VSRKSPPFVIAIDSREKLAYPFTAQTVKALDAGDYSIVGLEDRVAVERKRPAELFTCAGRERARFERELERLARFDYAALVIEGNVADLAVPSAFSRVNPRAVMNSLISWSVQYGIFVYFAGSREYARAITYRILEKFLKHQANGKIHGA